MNTHALQGRIAAAPPDLSQVPARARIVLSMLHRLAHGSLQIQLPNSTGARFGNGEPHAAVNVMSWQVFDRVIKSGDIGFAESYMDGEFTTDDLAKLLTLLNANRQAIDTALYGSWWGGLLYRIKHLFNRNTRAKARDNIQVHYDLGNDFYKLWLDETMTYSSALFDGDSTRTLAQAQHAKIARMFEQMHVGAGARVLEIGFGWGGVAQYAAQQGVHVTGLTLSQEQLVYARERLAAAGLADLAQFKLQDYRDERTNAAYDAIVSVEMFEAVGEEYWETYFDCVSRNLKQGGYASIQTITIDEVLFERYRSGTDFIQQYIFPGGMLPSPQRFEAHAIRAGLKVVNKLNFGADYARTLALWRAAFMAKHAQVSTLGFDEKFVRMWEFYLAYCEAGFTTRSTDVIQYTLQKV
ncbi:MAG: class I SAM-dependent methyltransferase [Burkholderiaceae bacterium]